MQINAFSQNAYQPLGHNNTKRTFGRELSNIEPMEKPHESKLEPMCHDSSAFKPPLPDLTADYQSDIYNTLIANENKHAVHPNYMSSQTDINGKMRAILIDWLVEVHLKFKLLSETLFLTTSLMDRYLERVIIKREKLQLVGITAMLIACKYEEIYAPEIKDFVYVTSNAYDKKEIQEMEMNMLQTLEYNITISSSWKFLQYYAKLIGFENGVEFCLSQYLMELSLLDLNMLRYTPSITAGGALYLAMKMVRKEVKWPNALKCHEKELKQCALSLCTVLKNNDINSKCEKGSLCSLKKKFGTPIYSGVSNIKIE